MQYPVIVEDNNRTAMEKCLPDVESKTIEVSLPQEPSLQPGTPQAWLKALEPFAGDAAAIREHFAEIAFENRTR